MGTLSTDVSTQSVAQTGDLGSGVFVVTSRQPTNGPTVVTVTFLSDQPGPFAINDLYWVTYLDCIEIPYDIKGLMSSSDQSAFPMRIQLPKAVLNVLDNCESSVPPHHQAEVSVNQLETVSIGKRRDNAQHISIEATLVVEDNVPFYVDKLRFEWVLDPETTNAMIPVEYNGIVSGYKYPPIEVTLPGPLYDEHS